MRSRPRWQAGHGLEGMRPAVSTLRASLLGLAGLLLALAGCGESAHLPVRLGMGPTPQLPAQVHRLIPTVDIAPARGWPANATPTAAPGLAVAAFARRLPPPPRLFRAPEGGVPV